jgi:hypothetical protein
MTHEEVKMRTRIMAMTALVVLLSLPVALHAQTDPAAVAMAMVDAFNTGDMDAMMAFFADDAVFKVVHLDATFTGAEEIRGLFENLVAQNFEQHIDEVLQVEGDTVTTRTSMSSDPLREMGVPVVSTQVYTVQDGKIKSVTCSWSEESVAKLQAAMAAAAEALPETGIPVASGGLLPAHLPAMALGGLALLGGIGLALVRRRTHPQS